MSLFERLTAAHVISVTVEGETFEVHRISVADRDNIAQQSEKWQESGVGKETSIFLATVAATCTQGGDYVFKAMSIDQLNSLPYNFLVDLFVEVSRHNKMGASDVEDAKENFTQTR